MNKSVFILLVFCGFLAGCAGVSPLPANGDMFGSTGTLNVTGCDDYLGAITVCSGDNKKPKVLINLDEDPFEISPKCVNAKKGKKIHFDLVSKDPIDAGTVVIFPKDPGNYSWFAGTNSKFNPDKIKIKVPYKKGSGSDLPAGEYAYGIYTEAQCMDPRVKVEN